MNKKVFVTRRLPIDFSKNPEFSILMYDKNEPIEKYELKGSLQTNDAIITCVCDKIGDDILSHKNRKVEVISNYAVGLDNIDLESAEKNKVFVYNTPDVVTDSTADLTMGLILMTSRHIGKAMNFIKRDDWVEWDPEIFLGKELKCSTLGIIGFGKIGQAVAKRARSFGMNVCYYNRSEKNVDGIKRCEDINELLEISDIISVHIPSTKETKGFIDKEKFKNMKKKPIFINTSRGDIVPNIALSEALKKGYISAAALDVVENEPIGYDHHLLAYDNCYVIPHIGTATVECRKNMAKRAMDNISLHYNIVDRVKSVFEKTFDEEFSINSDMYNTEKWDSLNHMSFILNLEDEFNIGFSYDKVRMMTDCYKVVKKVFSNVQKYR